ncbi:MAG: TauD/TfdA family dioxygenase [Acidimicrobiaceae bacterium]|nr:TauD/TfdA family dioxygenase [Acidimicrobiaceae bacterium]
MTDTISSNVTVHPLSGYTGAEISGVDISEPLDDESLETIKSALDTWKVVFFRNQHLDHASQVAFGEQFGPLTYAHPHDENPPEEHQEIYTVDRHRTDRRRGSNQNGSSQNGQERPRQRNVTRSGLTGGWHTDVTPAINPPAGSILRADILPPIGGDTTWTNLVAAYNGLSEPIQRFIDTLRAEHFYGADWQGLRDGYGESSRNPENRLVSHHPVVRVHPRTGEKILYVNPGFVDHILDVSPLESRWILGHLFNEIIRPEYTVRFHWEPGSVAFWDNRATAHLAPRDILHLDPIRVLHRVTLIGEVPVGPDGRESQLIEGVPFVDTPVFEPAD